MIRSLLRDFFASATNRSASSTAPPKPTEGLCVYAVGDVHGQRKELEALLARVEADAARMRADGLNTRIVFLGDYVDRGPDSRGVLDSLCALAKRSADGSGIACRFLLGNHEAAMLDFLKEPAANSQWLSFGGVETLGSYGVRASAGTTEPARCRALRDALDERLPDEHRRFLETLELMVAFGDYAFVHAGIRPGVALERQHPDDLLWIREPFLSSPRRHEKVIVHGHTVVERPEILDNRIGIDTGAYATGVLTAVALHGVERRILATAP
ncbi:hypothetical protein TSO221_12175 [Azospirillum sp. TSO22-1]|nr:hypothetical protein TSO221_12175 [Azospirillum sp. TSO22-1]